MHELRATGDAVWLQSPLQGITAHCTEVTFRRLPPDQGDETCLRGGRQVQRLGAEGGDRRGGPGQGLRRWVTTIRATDVTILEDGQDRENRTIVARGPGRLETQPGSGQTVESNRGPGPDLLESSPARNKPVEPQGDLARSTHHADRVRQPRSADPESHPHRSSHVLRPRVENAQCGQVDRHHPQAKSRLIRGLDAGSFHPKTRARPEGLAPCCC